MDSIPTIIGTPESLGYRVLHRAHGRTCALCGKGGGGILKCLCHGAFYCSALHYLYNWPAHKKECQARRAVFDDAEGSEDGYLRLQDWLHANGTFIGRAACNALLELSDHNLGKERLFETHVLFLRVEEVNTDVRRQGVQLVGEPHVYSKTAARAAYAAVQDEEHWNRLEAYSMRPGRGAGVLNVLVRFIGLAYQSLECVQIDFTEADMRGWRSVKYEKDWFKMLQVVTKEFPLRFIGPDGQITAIREEL